MIYKSLYVNGQWTEGNGAYFTSFNPATNESLWEGNMAEAIDVEAAVKSARDAFPQWAVVSFDERRIYIEKFAEKLAAQANDFAILISQETGKPLWESTMEVSTMIKKVEISIKAYHERCHETSISMAEGKRLTRFKPHGTVAVLGPFNLPGHLPNGHIIPALLAGNTMIFKPSDLTPLVGHRMLEIWESLGLPPGVLNLVQGGRETGMLLTRNNAIDGIFFTGSAEAGISFHQFYAGQPEKILALEMGGNNPLIVYDVRDLRAAAYLTIQSAFITSGQRCVCARRLIISKGQEGDEFLKQFIAMTKSIVVGPYTQKPEPFMGPVISAQAADKIAYLRMNLERFGGKMLLDMEELNNNQAMLTPGIIDVTDIENLSDQEIFGPLVQLIRVADFDEAIYVANKTVYGLAAGLLSDNVEYYKKFYALSRAGIINWNRPLTGASSEAPFGGIGRSGNHRPSAYFAADYCSYPVASMENEKLQMPESLAPGITLKD